MTNTTARPGSKKKTTAKKRTTTKKKTTKKTAKKTASKAGRLTIDEISSGARKLMLANLGLYGKVLDELQNQVVRAKKTIQDARRDLSKANTQLIGRGEKLIGQVKDLLRRSGAPAPKQLTKHLADLEEAVAKLKRKIGR